ncbi:MAG: hypothetical protein ACRYF7_23660 [Janthinobacterium lividum]
MQFRIATAFFIFLGSYLPLALILAAQDISATWWKLPICHWGDIAANKCLYNPFTHPALSLVPIIVTLLAVILSHITFKNISFPFTITVNSSKPIPNEIINYVFPYVVSFMGIAYDQQEKLVGFFIFLLWLFAITYKSGQIIMNPLLLMFGWKLYEADITFNGSNRSVRILKRGHLSVGPQKAQTIQDFYVTRD